MQVLIVWPEQRERIAEVVEYAKSPDHWYRENGPLPGDTPQHVCTLPVEIRCVFSYTVRESFVYRHLSVSIPRGYLDPEFVGIIGTEFGLTGWAEKRGLWPHDWALNIEEGVISVIQLVQMLE